jgi:hypothetical protein
MYSALLCVPLRRERLYNEEMDRVVRSHLDFIHACYKLYKAKVRKEEKGEREGSKWQGAPPGRVCSGGLLQLTGLKHSLCNTMCQGVPADGSLQDPQVQVRNTRLYAGCWLSVKILYCTCVPSYCFRTAPSTFGSSTGSPSWRRVTSSACTQVR